MLLVRPRLQNAAYGPSGAGSCGCGPWLLPLQVVVCPSHCAWPRPPQGPQQVRVGRLEREDQEAGVCNPGALAAPGAAVSAAARRRRCSPGGAATAASAGLTTPAPCPRVPALQAHRRRGG